MHAAKKLFEIWPGMLRKPCQVPSRRPSRPYRSMHVSVTYPKRMDRAK